MTNDTRTQLDLAALFIGALLALIAAALLSGCSTIRTMPGIGAALTPDWDEATLSSNWQGANAEIRHMNNLSPAISEDEFKARIAWALSIGCNAVHWFISNKGDGQYAGYCIYGNAWTWAIDKSYCDLFRERISYARSKGLAVVIWLMADDSSAWNRAALGNANKYLGDLDSEGLLDYASTVVVGLELGEYCNAGQVAGLVAATRKVYDGKIGTHEGSGKITFASLGDIVFYQVSPGKTAAWIKAEAARVKAATGKPVNFFELSRSPDRTLSQAALDGGAFGVGNWDG